jgi:hypothetical protein
MTLDGVIETGIVVFSVVMLIGFALVWYVWVTNVGEMEDHGDHQNPRRDAPDDDWSRERDHPHG